MENFQLGDRIGSGAFGSVYKVIRKEDSKIYAMKRVKITQLGTKEKDNALNEIRILASFNHPNIIGYKEAFYDDNSQTLNIVMEYADDGDIESKISNNKLNKLSFQESTIWNILIQILQGLKFLHDNNIIHRDLKSANIFLMKNGLIKIGDLNVSKLSKIGSANTHTGTPYYSSPEIWTEQSYNYKTDIWSVGCIIYEMCNLSPPFRGTSLINLFNNIQKGVYKPVNKMYSKDLAKVISKMLIVDPEKRPSCDQLLSLNVIESKMNDIQKRNDNDYKVDLIQTIKFPKKLNDINKILPHKKMYNVENEMMMNDEFETKKAGFFKAVNKEINKENTNKGNNHINKQNNLINNPAKNNLNIKRPSSSFQSKNKEQKKIVINHSQSHKNPHYNNRYQNNIYQSNNNNIDNQNNNNLQNNNNQHNNNHHNNIHHNKINQNNNNNNLNNYIQINNILQQNNKVRPSSGRKVPNNLVNNNRPNNNLINNNNAYHSNKIKNIENNKIQLDNKNKVKIRAESARPSHKMLSNNNIKNNNNNNLNNNNNVKVKIISSKGSNNNNNKIIIEKINYISGGKKKQISKSSVGYKPKIGNRK